MAERHKSKYKTPKDFEKSQKPKLRKDLKDYTADDKKGGLNPKSTGEKQTNVLRKTDKTMQDDGKLYPTYNDNDRLYKDLENGEYDPKTAAKRLKKRQDTEEKDVEDVLQDKIENLTREQRERLVRRIVNENTIIQAEDAIENCDENDDMAMERCVDNLFADMTEEDAENYIMELSRRKPKWLRKLVQWFRRTGRKIKREVRRTKKSDKIADSGALVTFAALGTLFIKKFSDITDKIQNLNREQREILVREYVRRKIVKVLREQPEPPAPDAPEETPPADAPAPGVPDLTGTQPGDTPAPGAPPAGPPAPAPDATPAPPAPAPDADAESTETKLEPAAQEALAIQKFVNHLREKETGNIARLKTISKVINNVLKDSEPEDFKNFFMMLKSLAIKKLQQGNPTQDNGTK